jgi:hypothetical protein
MVKFKKMDEKDFVFLNKEISKEEEKLFSDFLKSKKRPHLQNRTNRKVKNKALA